MTLQTFGSNFTPSDEIVFNGTVVATTYISSTLLEATVDSSRSAEMRTPGYLAISVRNGDSPQLDSSPIALTVENPTPTVSALSVASIPIGSSGFEQVVTGSSFMPTSVVLWNGDERPTTYVSANELRFTVSEQDLAIGRLVMIAVSTGAPGGGTSDALAFDIEAVQPTAVVGSGAGLASADMLLMGLLTSTLLGLTLLIRLRIRNRN